MTDYPRMLYHADGRNMTVDDEAAEKAASGDGFGREPTQAARDSVPASTVVPSGQSDLADLIADRVVERLMAAKSSDDEPKRGPGRPRKDQNDAQ